MHRPSSERRRKLRVQADRRREQLVGVEQSAQEQVVQVRGQHERARQQALEHRRRHRLRAGQRIDHARQRETGLPGDQPGRSFQAVEHHAPRLREPEEVQGGGQDEEDDRPTGRSAHGTRIITGI